MKKLHIVLRTCDKSEVHASKDGRILPVSKTELVKRCVASLLKDLPDTAHVTIVDDHSSDDLVAYLKDQNATFCPVKDTGNQASMLEAYNAGLLGDGELVYFVEDDYLHAAGAIKAMLEAYELFKQKLPGAEIAIHPQDDPTWYRDGVVEPCFLVHELGRHWRSGRRTTFTVMMSRAAVLHGWETLREFAASGVEDGTINTLWDGKIALFSPIPGLAVHCQFVEPTTQGWREW